MSQAQATAHAASCSPPTTWCISVRFVTDRCVTTRVDSREAPEWPPHPGRLFMALAATFFETDGESPVKEAEKRALEWLCSLPAPRIKAVDAETRTTVTFYVPVNDAAQPNKSMLQSAPGMPRSRQPRTFPTAIPLRSMDDDPISADVSYEWACGATTGEHLPAIERLCRNLVRIGHSSSLVLAWVDTGNGVSGDGVWEPNDERPEVMYRIAVDGELQRLSEACRAEEIELFADLASEIESTKGKEQKAAKERFAKAFGKPWKSHVVAPEPSFPTLGVWQGYRRAPGVLTSAMEAIENVAFERDLLILARLDGPTLDVERTLALTMALRSALLSQHGEAEMPAWLTGHEPDGAPTSVPHLAFLALPYVGYEHADGHLMGLAIALPKGVDPGERARWLRPLLVDRETGEPSDVRLDEGVLRVWGRRLPEWTLQLEQRQSPPMILRNATWTKPSHVWSSVTPVVLDRFPHASKTTQPEVWQAEVEEIISTACERSGLPRPIETRVGTTAWLRGVPRSSVKTRLGSGLSRPAGPGSLGDGFPSMPERPGRPKRPQFHVWLRFSKPVAGPVLIGAGRFFGYGLCKPVAEY